MKFTTAILRKIESNLRESIIEYVIFYEFDDCNLQLIEAFQ